MVLVRLCVGTKSWLQGNIQKLTHHGHVYEKVFKQGPHVVAGVDFFHLDLRVDVAVVQEIDVGVFHLKLIEFRCKEIGTCCQSALPQLNVSLALAGKCW